jgi:hypothetical protein
VSFVMLEFLCEEHGRFESLELRATAPDAAPCPECGASSPWCISSPLPKPQYGAVSQGKVSKAPVPLALDTEPLANGMSMRDWKKRRKALWDNERIKRVKRMVST